MILREVAGRKNDHVINEIIVEKLISIIWLSITILSLAACLHACTREMQKPRCRYKKENVNNKNEKFLK